MLAVKILVEAVVVILTILEQQRSRTGLAGGMAALDEGGMVGREADVYPHGFVPSVGDRREARVKGRAQALDQRRQRVGKVFVLAAAVAVPGHDDLAAEAFFVAVETDDRVALWRRQKPRENRPALGVEVGGSGRPVDRTDAIAAGARLCRGAHATPSRLISFLLRWTPQR